MALPRLTVIETYKILKVCLVPIFKIWARLPHVFRLPYFYCLIMLWIAFVNFHVDYWYKKSCYDIGNPHFILFSHYPSKKSFFRAQSLNWQEMKTQVFQKMLASSFVYLTKDYQTIYFQVKHNDDIYKRILPTSKNLFW